MEKKHLWIIIIFLAILALRLFFAFQYPNFSYDAHFAMRQIDNIKKTGMPIYNDPLSYGGRINLFAPFFYYVMAEFSIIIPFALKIMPNLFAAVTVFLVYLITSDITKNRPLSLVTAFLSGLLPLFFNRTLNSLSAHAMVAPLMLAFLYCILRSEDRRYFYFSLIFLILLLISSPLTFILIITMIIFLLLLKLESIDVKKAELEFTLFLTFLITWFNFLLFKKAFQVHGLEIIWQNIPAALVGTFFTEFTFLKAISAIGIFTLVFGVYGLYHVLFETKKRQHYILVAFGLSILLLLLFKLTNINTGLIYVGIILIIFSGYSLDLLYKYLKRTKFSRYATAALTFIIFIFALTLLLPSVSYAIDELNNIPSKAEVDALEWLTTNSHDDQTVLATLKQGHLITYYAKRKNVIDSNYFLIQNIQIRYDEVNTVFTTKLQTEAVSLLNKYDVNYIMLTDLAREKYNMEDLSYVDDYTCFTLIYDEANVKIYNVYCELIEVQNE